VEKEDVNGCTVGGRRDAECNLISFINSLTTLGGLKDASAIVFRNLKRKLGRV
jgi:hypothetical protein